MTRLNDFLLYLKTSNDPVDIYQELAYYNIPLNLRGLNIISARDNIINYGENLVNSHNVHSSICRLQSRNENSYKHLNVNFNKSEVGIRDLIKLYIPMKFENLENDSKKLYDFLFENKINFQSKVSPSMRNDLFCLRVNNKEDANKIISFCKHNIELEQTNPFIAKKDNIGVAKDTYNVSYNMYVKTLLEEYKSVFKDSNSANLLYEFHTFVRSKKYNDSRDIFMNQTLLSSLDSVIYNTDILDNLDDNKIEFDSELYSSYKRFEIDNEYYYTKHNMSNNINVVKRDAISLNNNPALYFKLQSMNFMHKANIIDSFPKEYLDKISLNLDNILDNKGGVSSNIRFNNLNEKSEQLLPYLYAYIAMEKKQCNITEAFDVLQITKSSINFNKNTDIKYNLLQNDTQSVELTKKQNGFYDLKVKDNDASSEYKDVFIELEGDVLTNYKLELSRNLLDLNRNTRMIESREGHLGYFKVENNSLKKYVSEDSISLLKQKRNNTNIYAIENNFSKVR